VGNYLEIVEALGWALHRTGPYYRVPTRNVVNLVSPEDIQNFMKVPQEDLPKYCIQGLPENLRGDRFASTQDEVVIPFLRKRLELGI
jgi:hypothetical protein